MIGGANGNANADKRENRSGHKNVSENGEEITVRKWVREDCFAVSEIEKLCFSDPWTEEMVIGSFSDDYFLGYVAETKGKIIGYIGLSVVFDTADVLLVAVIEKYRRRGVAKTLFARAFEEARENGAERAMLEVDVKNAAAIGCYLCSGFKKVTERKNYYGAGKDAFIMEKTLLNDL